MAYSILSSVYQATVNTGAVRYRQIPTAAAGIVIADDAAWDEIVDNTIITTDHWVAVLNIGLPAAGITTDCEEVIAEGSGGANGAVTAAGTLLIEQELLATIDTAVGEYVNPICYLPVPIKVLALTRHAGRISTSITGGIAISLGFSIITGLG